MSMDNAATRMLLKNYLKTEGLKGIYVTIENDKFTVIDFKENPANTIAELEKEVAKLKLLIYG